jgi:pantothenate synthetase
VKKALVERANRAKVASRNKRLTPEERKKEKKIADIFYRAEKKMVLDKDPPIPKREKHDEHSAVHEEAEDHEKYLKMEEEAKKEGRPKAAEIYHNHAEDELRHEHEDQEAEKIKAT